MSKCQTSWPSTITGTSLSLVTDRKRELDSEIGTIPAEQLLNFFTETIGPFYYNQGLSDAQAVLARLADNISDEIYGLEQREARTG